MSELKREIQEILHGKPTGEREREQREVPTVRASTKASDTLSSKPVGLTNYNNIPEKVVKYKTDINFESDDIRYFFKKITGRSWRGNDEDCYNELLFHLHAKKPQFIAEWKKRKANWEKQFKRRVKSE